MDSAPHIQRVRHELRRRRLTVMRIERGAPQLRRLVLGGDELAGFTSLGFDDHVKLFFDDSGAPAMRDFTPRRYDAARGELWIDFYLHDAGPATNWAAQATPGQTLEIAGPKGSAVVAMRDIGTHVLIGDETAVPAISRRLEELPRGARALAIVETGGEEWLAPATQAVLETIPVRRPAHEHARGQALIDALRTASIATERSYFWIAAESNAARAIRRYLVEERGIDKRWIKAAGYWRRNAAGQHERIDDEI
jgi:NADPH-dependent ferric siderophore reductase